MASWLFVIVITYTVVGFAYQSDEDEIIDVKVEQPTGSWQDMIVGFITALYTIIISFFSILFFVLPEIPLWVWLIINIPVQICNLIFLIGAWPYLKEFARLVMDGIDFLTGVLGQIFGFIKGLL